MTVHTTVRVTRDGRSLYPSVATVEYFSAEFPGDVPANLKPIYRKKTTIIKKTISIGLPPNKRLI